MKRLMKMLLCVWCLVIRATWAGNASAGGFDPVEELASFNIVGRIANADNIAYDAMSGIRLFVIDKDGNRLTQSNVFTPGTEPYNFLLQVPLATVRSPGYAMKGDAIQLTVLIGGESYTGFLKAGEDVVGAPGTAVHLRILLAEDSNGNGIADSYEEAMLDEMKSRGIGGTYDPEADYDDDGLSNRNEYLTGTDAFNKDDYFHATMVGGDASGDYIAISFKANAGRTYAVKESPDLKTWNPVAFRLTPDSEEEVKAVSSSSQEWTMRTVYLPKDGKNHFYRLEMME